MDDKPITIAELEALPIGTRVRVRWARGNKKVSILEVGRLFERFSLYHISVDGKDKQPAAPIQTLMRHNIVNVYVDRKA